MRFRHFVQTTAALALAAGLSTPALAGDKHRHHDRDDRPEWREDRMQFDREAWLDDCRERVSLHRRDNGVGGAVIGGVAGGLLGNRIAGRGNRTVGTIAGAAVGAVAGAAIDKAEDRGRDRDECETWLDDYYAGAAGYGHPGYAPGYAQPGYGYGYYGAGAPMVMVPVMMPGKPCVETETVEYVTPRPARRVIPRRPDKRIRIAPDKRVPLK